MIEDTRLDRIEKKLDRLTDAVTAIARVEEKILASNHRVDALEIRIMRSEKDLNEIAILARKNSGIAAFADKAFWLVSGAIIGAILFFVKGK